MALNMTQKYTKTEVWTVPSGTDAGVPVVQPVTGADGTNIKGYSRPGFTLVAEGADTKNSPAIGPYTITGIPSGGVGLPAGKATVAIDGAFRYDVTGATNALASGTAIFAVVSGGAVTSLTTAHAAGVNVPFGIVDRFIGEKSATETSVWVGRFVDQVV